MRRRKFFSNFSPKQRFQSGNFISGIFRSKFLLNFSLMSHNLAFRAVQLAPLQLKTHADRVAFNFLFSFQFFRNYGNHVNFYVFSMHEPYELNRMWNKLSEGKYVQGTLLLDFSRFVLIKDLNEIIPGISTYILLSNLSTLNSKLHCNLWRKAFKYGDCT